MKILNRIIYGNTIDSPKYITKRKSWLLNNEWSNTSDILYSLGNEFLEYNWYSKSQGIQVSHSFDEVLEGLINDPMTFKVLSVTEYSTQELNHLLAVQKSLVSEQFDKRVKDINKVLKSNDM